MNGGDKGVEEESGRKIRGGEACVSMETADSSGASYCQCSSRTWSSRNTGRGHTAKHAPFFLRLLVLSDIVNRHPSPLSGFCPLESPWPRIGSRPSVRRRKFSVNLCAALPLIVFCPHLQPSFLSRLAPSLDGLCYILVVRLWTSLLLLLLSFSWEHVSARPTHGHGSTHLKRGSQDAMGLS